MDSGEHPLLGAVSGTSAMLSKSDASMLSTTSTLKNNLDVFMGTLTADVNSKLATVQSNVNALYAKSARNVVKLQQAREESLRLQTQNLEHKTGQPAWHRLWVSFLSKICHF